ncbi:MAG: long-chain fatty acid--CoA ligase [Acidimicrobiia bacterium]|nr:long-chain fatty acid--CoA ligase [Acidimicrobiia bacterium]
MPPHMLDFPLLLSTLYERAVRIYPHQEVVSVNADGSLRRSTYGETDDRVRRLVAALDRLGIRRGEVVGTLAWNTHRHHEIYWATANTGRICHTVNLRLSADHIRYIIDHGRDRAVFISGDMVEAVERLAPDLPGVEYWIMLDGDPDATSLPGAIAYEDLISDPGYKGSWPELDERSPHMYCYTSGTTGNPKGVAYTQRSTYMHALSGIVFSPLAARDNIMPVVPMFHAAAWGHPFMAITAGCKITYPGHDLSAEGLVNLIEGERVTFSAGVPTVWLAIQHYLEDHPERDISSIHSFMCGGSAVPRAMIDWYWRARGIRVIQGWGMTETNPVATFSILRPEMEDWDWERQLDFIETAGLLIPGLRAKIVDDEGRELPQDGEAFGELLVQGPWVAAEYIRDERTADTMVDGWLRTGDVCKITPEGYIRVTDRAKDVIKSGGEWISSIDLENLIMAHPKVAEAAVVGVEHSRWQERPIALVVPHPGGQVSDEELAGHLRGKVADWWLPDAYVTVYEIPKTSTGKFDKKVMRDRYASVLTDQP